MAIVNLHNTPCSHTCACARTLTPSSRSPLCAQTRAQMAASTGGGAGAQGGGVLAQAAGAEEKEAAVV